MPYKDPMKRRRYNLEYKIRNRDRLRPLEIERTKQHRLKVRKHIEAVKAEAKCERCGENEAVCLDFHHRNPADKNFQIAVAANLGVSMKNLKIEMAKCILVCANCHRKIHAGLVSAVAR